MHAGFLAFRETPNTTDRMALFGRGLTGKCNGHPGTPIQARFKGRFEDGRYEGSGI